MSADTMQLINIIAIFSIAAMAAPVAEPEAISAASGDIIEPKACCL
jgi:hypothetical protein